VAFTLHAGGARSRCVHFGGGSRLPAEPDRPVDAAVRLEVNRWNGSTEPRLILRHAAPAAARPIEVVGEPALADGVEAELARDLARWGDAATAAEAGSLDALTAAPGVRDLRGTGIAGLLADLVATGEPVLAVTAHPAHRARALGDRAGGFAVCSWAALEDDPALADGYAHLVAVDPPAHEHRVALLERPSERGWTHLAWGEPEVRFAARIHQWDFALRDPLTALYRCLRRAGEARGEAAEAMLRGEGPQPWTPAKAGRLVRVLTELDLVVLDREGRALRVVEAPAATALERSSAFRAYHRCLEDGRSFLTTPRIRAAA
jgi:single-stranded-DNA-specific exonuclease